MRKFAIICEIWYNIIGRKNIPNSRRMNFMQKSQNISRGNNNTRNGKASGTAKFVGMTAAIVAIGAALFFLLGPLCRWISATTASAADFIGNLGTYALETWDIFACWVLVLAVLFGLAYLILRLILKAVTAVKSRKGDDYYQEV